MKKRENKKIVSIYIPFSLYYTILKEAKKSNSYLNTIITNTLEERFLQTEKIGG